VVEELGALPRCADGEGPALPEGFEIYFAGDPDIDNECLLLMPDGRLARKVFRNYEDAAIPAAQLFITPPGIR